uniref:Uncharacterized protein n=1 Tax=Pristionchus pacificus TaxID=54126 RepID=A0A2A6BF75_PRIPA|eukprot:PDM64537.1 hypothetical protein PRIPAC_52793 [Pristionchus pacificus]
MKTTMTSEISKDRTKQQATGIRVLSRYIDAHLRSELLNDPVRESTWVVPVLAAQELEEGRVVRLQVVSRQSLNLCSKTWKLVIGSGVWKKKSGHSVMIASDAAMIHPMMLTLKRDCCNSRHEGNETAATRGRKASGRHPRSVSRFFRSLTTGRQQNDGEKCDVE